MLKKLSFLLLTIIPILSGLTVNAQWVQVSNGMGNITVWSLAANVNTIFAGTDSGVYLSSTNGTNWTQTSLNNQYVRSLAVNGNYVFAGTNGVYLSTNNGTSWTQTSLNNYLAVYSLAVNGNSIFAGIHYPNGVYLSNDNGTTWSSAGLNQRFVYALATSANNVFAGTGNSNNWGVYLSTNYGTNWTYTSLNHWVYSLAVNGIYIFAGSSLYGVLVSTNNGTTWTQTSLYKRTVFSLAVNGNNVFAGTDTSGVFVSNNNGANWTQRNEGLGNFNVGALCTFNDYIFAGTHGSGVYRRPLSELTGIKPISEQVPSHYALEQNYPNPFNPRTKIRFDIPSPSPPSKGEFVVLKIYDILGREIATLVNEQLKPGVYEVEWVGSNYPSGVYYYQLRIRNYELGIDFSEAKKMVLVK